MNGVQRAVDVAQTHERLIQSRIEMMRGYAETTGCRRQYLLGYFGEQLPHRCGTCDTCDAGTADQQPAGNNEFPVNSSVQQAEAAVQQGKSNENLAKVTAGRWENLQKMDAVAQQETDERTNAYAQAQANLAAATANVRRLEEVEFFKHVYAPFSGVLTRRNVDIGALINAGNNGSNQQLFNIAKIDPIRVYINMPEIYASSVHPGVPATLEVTSLAGQRFTGTVVRSADAIDPATRTLLTEIDVPNRKGELLPGAYAQVHFDLKIQAVRLSVPVNALMFRAGCSYRLL